MRLVLDTNSAVSAFLWRGPPHEILEVARVGRVTLFVSPSLIVELTDVLARPKFRSVFQKLKIGPTDVISDYGGLAGWVYPSVATRFVPNDADDDEIVAAAVAASADLVVSGDHDLLELGTVAGIRVVTATEALKLIRRQAERP
jgi:putative PIN family toxin of toxin-antitoxin system